MVQVEEQGQGCMKLAGGLVKGWVQLARGPLVCQARGLLVVVQDSIP